MGIGAGAATALSPLLVGLIAPPWGARTGGGGRSTYSAIPVFFVAFLAFRLPEPPRGQFEKKDVLGEVIGDPLGLPRRPGSGVPADPAHPHDQDMSHRLLCDRVRLVHRSGARQPLPQAALRSRCVPARTHRHHREHRRAGGSSARRALLRPPVPQGSCAAVDADRHRRPSGRHPHPHSVLHADCRPVGRVQRPGRGAPPTAFSMVGPVLISVAPYRLRGMVGAVGGISTSSSSVPPVGPCWPPCSTAWSECGPQRRSS